MKIRIIVKIAIDYNNSTAITVAPSINANTKYLHRNVESSCGFVVEWLRVVLLDLDFFFTLLFWGIF